MEFNVGDIIYLTKQGARVLNDSHHYMNHYSAREVTVTEINPFIDCIYCDCGQGPVIFHKEYYTRCFAPIKPSNLELF